MPVDLVSKSGANSRVSDLFRRDRTLDLFVGEDTTFHPDVWLSVGDVTLKPDEHLVLNDDDLAEGEYDCDCAVRFGGFEWTLPTAEDMSASIKERLPANTPSDEVSKVNKQVVEGLQDAVRRTHLAFPVFDMSCISRMPLRLPLTVVPDTSAVIQGGLDFVCRFLTPAARIKVPAIVHMEIDMHVDNYFAARYSDQKTSGKGRIAALRHHLKSQGGQRTLIRLELSTETELDRGDLGADPLRGIVTAASDTEDKALSLSKVTKSFCDRLIVETARHFRSHVRPDHPIAVLTSDQGLARMAMAEGLGVLFFQARSLPVVLGTTFTGAVFHPFTSEVVTVSLTDVLWELAVSFGCVKLASPDGLSSLELWAIGAGDTCIWRTDHAQDDLLWLNAQMPEALVAPAPAALVDHGEVGQDTGADDGTGGEVEFELKGDVIALQEVTLPPGTGWYKVSPTTLFRLIEELSSKHNVSKETAQIVTGLKSSTELRRYLNFLATGGFLSVDATGIHVAPALKEFWQAVSEGSGAGFLNHLRRIPSFEVLYRYVMFKRVTALEDPDLPVSQTARNAYINLGEAAMAWLAMPGVGLVATDRTCSAEAFVHVALEAYRSLTNEQDGEFVLTGKWLEEVARVAGMHPLVARTLLQEACARNIINLYLEGSTPDTRFEDHYMWVLLSVEGRPELRRVFLYHGDFLTPGTASVRMRLEGVHDAT